MGARGRPLRTTRTVANLRERPGWYRIANQAAGPVKVSIYDEIGMLGVSADDLLRDLAQVDGDIELHLNSPGGDVFDGIAIFNTLRQRAGQVAVVVDGLAASAASFIAQAASPGLLAMAPHSQMMIHDGFGLAIGNAADMREMAGLLDKASDNISRIYADRAGKPAAYWRERMQAETWYDDHEAVAEGLADSVIGQERPRDRWDLSVYLHATRNADGNHAEMTGTHSHSHPDMAGGAHAHTHAHDGEAAHAPHVTVWDPDGDGDDDTHAATDTDHDHWTEDGQPVRGASNRDGHAVRNDADESAWDGSAAMSAAASSDNPASAYAAICAGKRAGDTSKQSTWALPHHKHPGDPPNAAGVRNALAQLPQTQGLTNESAARSHLEAHMKSVSPDSDTSDLATDQLWMEVVAALEGSE